MTSGDYEFDPSGRMTLAFNPPLYYVTNNRLYTSFDVDVQSMYIQMDVDRKRTLVSPWRRMKVD